MGAHLCRTAHCRAGRAILHREPCGRTRSAWFGRGGSLRCFSRVPPRVIRVRRFSPVSVGPELLPRNPPPWGLPQPPDPRVDARGHPSRSPAATPPLTHASAAIRRGAGTPRWLLIRWCCQRAARAAKTDRRIAALIRRSKRRNRRSKHAKRATA